MKPLFSLAALATVLSLNLLMPVGMAADAPVAARTAAAEKDPGIAATGAEKGHIQTEGLLNKLLAPGPLLLGHKNLEGSQCLKCHTAGSGVPDNRCLECHKEINTQVVRRTGYHGLMTRSCVQCHSDHKGRNYDSTKVNPKAFNHNETGFALEGKHARLDCEKCHTSERGAGKDGLRDVVRPHDTRYFWSGPAATCVYCHKKEDPHLFPMESKWAKKDCNACHGSSVSWKKGITFDHEKDTGYALQGAHAKMKCAECHTPKNQPVKYKWPNLEADKCLACHEDHHGENLSGNFQGGECTRCHNEKTWKLPRFKHEITGYPLRGAHESLNCTACHRQAPAVARVGMKSRAYKFTGLDRACASCHADYHGYGNIRSEKLGPLNACETCHTESHWKPFHSFDHGTDTNYIISGKHLKVSCFQCHIKATDPFPQAAEIRERPSETYLPATAHPGKVGKGSALRAYRWEALNKKTCENCHRSPHLKTFPPELLAKRCTECHTEEGWKIIGKKRKFDHDRATRFPLTGKHRRLSCNECHHTGKQEIYKFPSFEKGFCVDCHRNVHIGQFGDRFTSTSCAVCHTTTGWVRRKQFDHKTTDFPLTGRHTASTCDDCHVLTSRVLASKPPRQARQFLFANQEKGYCESCHTNVHRGQFGPTFDQGACAICHTTRDFIHRLPFRHEASGFALRGKHNEIRCSACHTPTDAVFPSLHGMAPHHKAKFIIPGAGQNNCAACHADPHKGAFGHECVDCHNEQDWHQVRNFHKNFTLTGIHNTLACAQCHRDGRRLAGESQNCILCHQKEDVHNHSLPDCGTCHRQDFWIHTSFLHSMTQFPLRGAHRTLDCTACHANNIYRGLPNTCIDCHQGLALATPAGGGVPDHHLLIGQQCNNCHNEFSFH